MVDPALLNGLCGPDCPVARANQIFGPKNFVFTQQLLGVLNLAQAQANSKQTQSLAGSSTTNPSASVNGREST